MRTIVLLALTSLRRLSRDRSSFFFTILFPLAIIFLIGTAIGWDGGALPVGAVAQSRGPLAAEVAASLEKSPAFHVVVYESKEDLSKAVRRGTVAAGIVIPDTYDTALREGLPASVELVVDRSAPFPALLRQAVASTVDRHNAVWSAARLTASTTSLDGDGGARLASEVLASGAGAGVVDERVGAKLPDADGTRVPDGFAYTAPSNLVLFVFMTSIVAASMLVESRRLGLLRRTLAAPVTPWRIVAGEGLGRLLIAAGQAAVILLAGRLLFGVRWGHPLGAAMLVAAFTLVATGTAMLIGTMLRTEEQSFSVGLPVGIAAGMLGGCMWPLEIVPTPMRAFGHLFPHAWAMDGFIELIGNGAGPGDVLVNVVVLLGFAAVLFPLASWRLRAALTT